MPTRTRWYLVALALWAFALLPAMVFFRPISGRERVRTLALAAATGAAVYVVTNPFVPINLLLNRGVLFSNVGTSTGMYQVTFSVSGLLNARSRFVKQGVREGDVITTVGGKIISDVMEFQKLVNDLPMDQRTITTAARRSGSVVASSGD